MMEGWSHMEDGPHGRKSTWDRRSHGEFFSHVIPDGAHVIPTGE